MYASHACPTVDLVAGASEYFKRTENIAGVKDMRFQALMPDVLHWLGITKIDRMLSMSKWVAIAAGPSKH